MSDSKPESNLETESMSSSDVDATKPSQGDNDADQLQEPQEKTTDLEKGTTTTSAVDNNVLVDWDSPEDPGNPMNWPTWKKFYTIFSIGYLSFAITASSSMISPATESIMADFGVSRTAALLSITMFVLGLALGPMIAAPLSETLGRTIIYKITPPVYLLFLLGAGFTDSFGGMLVCRLLAGTAGAPVLAVGSGTIADMFPPAQRATMSSLYIMAPFLGPALGPVIGGFASEYKGWRWTIWCMEFVGIVALLLCAILPETFKKTILARRAKFRGLIPPPTPAAAQEFTAYIKRLIGMTLGRPLGMLVREPIVLLLSIYTSFTFGVLFAFFAAYPYTFGTVYHFTTWQSGLAFLGIGIGVILGVVNVNLCFKFISVPIYRAAAATPGKAVEPEHRLYAAMIGAVGLPIGLFWFAWTATPSVHWISPILAGIPFAFGNISLFVSSVLYMIDIYGPQGGASALAANGFLRYSLGACFPLFTVQMYKALGIGWATSLLGFVCVALMPIPFAFFKYGPAIRRRGGLSK